MSTQLMDETALKAWIMRRLGAPFLKVELCDENLVDAVESARRWFSAKKGVKAFAMMAIMPSQTEYVLPDIVDTVIDVVFQAQRLDIALVFSPFTLIDDKVPYDTFRASGASGGMYSSFTQTLQYVETAKRILGAEPDWRQENRLLYIFPLPQNMSAMRIEFKSSTVTIEQLSERDHDLLKRYALAKAKEDLATVRSKYDSFPTAQGTATLNWQKLADEASGEIEKLDEEIALSGFPMGFISG